MLGILSVSQSRAAHQCYFERSNMFFSELTCSGPEFSLREASGLTDIVHAPAKGSSALVMGQFSRTLLKSSWCPFLLLFPKVQISWGQPKPWLLCH